MNLLKYAMNDKILSCWSLISKLWGMKFLVSLGVLRKKTKSWYHSTVAALGWEHKPQSLASHQLADHKHIT